ncbi:hypothetical protein G647_00284 [Cladophialophora carrionii CBS 160.54]|uniref:Xylose isomerase-like TIM barrel domain-containing protein n=1 Tax=Cladophialophora carrionii CBS 160.54 TaxID=1279043 RepID=V9DLU8_9EURO|nr:uncharacterized protein G647_00284 [Cladophialophora carrionii CBS 160.54]ETI27835.1 hypothetical protein G647_00284 [Cladophialophora carrionii CBS 160.54]
MGSRFIPTIASQSLGRAWYHGLEEKLELCSKYGFEAIELFFEDLEAVANSLPTSHPPSPVGTSFVNSTERHERQLAAADYIHGLCSHYDLEILCLQPFMHYEGRVDPTSHEAAIEELKFWIKLAQRLGTDLIQIPSSFLPASECTGDRDRIVADLRQVADMGLHTGPPTRFAYEALAWGTHIDRWDSAWSVVQEVDRPNFGTCIDTFNLAGRIFADPASPSGLTADACDDIRRTVAMLKTELPLALDKVFYVEVCDGERLAAPLSAGHEWYDPNQPARMTWSRNARLFPFEAPGYLPVLDILEAVCEAGYTGHISFELFSRTANQPEKHVPEQHAQRGALAWRKLVEHMCWYQQTSRHSSDLLHDRRYAMSRL